MVLQVRSADSIPKCVDVVDAFGHHPISSSLHLLTISPSVSEIEEKI